MLPAVIQVDAQVAASEAMEQTGLAVDEQDGLSAALDDKAACLQRLQHDLDSVLRERDAAAQQASHITPCATHPAPFRLALCKWSTWLARGARHVVHCSHDESTSQS